MGVDIVIQNTKEELMVTFAKLYQQMNSHFNH